MTKIIKNEIPGTRIIDIRPGDVSPGLKNQTIIQKYAVCLDWLEISFKLQDAEKFESVAKKTGYRIVKHHGTSTYQHSIVVYQRELRLCQMWWHGHGAIPKNSGKLKFDNHVLYNRMRLQFWQDISKAFQLMDAKVCRADIAIDTREQHLDTLLNYSNIESIVKDIVSEKIELSKKNSCSFYKQKGVYTGVSIGKSPKRLTIYNKTVELKKSEKIYIKKIHEQLNGKGEVIRIEGQLRKMGKTSYQDEHGNKIVITPSKLFEVDTQVKLMTYILSKKFDIRQKNQRYARGRKIISYGATAVVKETEISQKDRKKRIISGLIKDSKTVYHTDDLSRNLNTAYWIAQRWGLQIFFFEKLRKAEIEEEIELMRYVSQNQIDSDKEQFTMFEVNVKNY